MSFLANFLGVEPKVIEKEITVYKNIPDDRFTSYLSLDKPIYKLGDVIYIKVVILHSNLCTPIPSKENCFISIIGPNNSTLQTMEINQVENSTIGACYTIPIDYAGGKYKIQTLFTNKNIIDSSREFEIREFQNPRLTTHIDFVRKGYSAGDKCIASVTSKRIEGGFPENAVVEFTARVDGQDVDKGKATLDSKGSTIIQFDLPKEIKAGDGMLTCVVFDGEVNESATKTIPIISKTVLNVEIFPEGGDLIANLESSFYVESKFSYGEPADITADIVDSNGLVVGSVHTKHEGRGKSSFTPQENLDYKLVLTKLSGVDMIIPFPRIHPLGVVLSAKQDCYEADQPIDFSLTASKKGTYYAGIYKRQVELGRLKLQIKQDGSKIDFSFSVPSNQMGSGVLRVLIMDGISPMAERLIFRKSSDSVQIRIVPNNVTTSPGETCKFKVYTTNEAGKGVQSIIGLLATDLSVLETLDKRKRPPRLVSQVFLENEVDHLEDAEVYLSNEPNAEIYMDLLLGTQGWRRFAFLDMSKLLQTEKGEKIASYREKVKQAPNVTINAPKDGHFGFDQFFVFDSKGKCLYTFKSDQFPLYSSDKIYRALPKLLENNAQKLTVNLGEGQVLHMLKDENTNRVFIINGPETYLKVRIAFAAMTECTRVDYKDMERIIKNTRDKISDAQIKIDEVKRLMIENIDRITQRGEQLESLNERSDLLENTSNIFKSRAKVVQPSLFGAVRGLFSQGPNISPMSNSQSYSIKEPIEPTIVTSQPMFLGGLLPPGNKSITQFGTNKQFTATMVFPDGWIREYSHLKTKSQKRSDFTETLFWYSNVMTDSHGVSPEFSFQLSDSITSFDIQADAFTNSGFLGQGSVVIKNNLPFYLEPKLPVEVTFGDEMMIPLFLVNSTEKEIKVNLNASGAEFKQFKDSFFLEAHQRRRVMYNLVVTKSSMLTFSGEATGDVFDTVSRNLKVVNNGFPASFSFGGRGDKIIKFDLDNIVENSISPKFYFFDSPIAHLFQASKRLIKEPYGCFEQISSTSYPMVLAYQLLIQQNPLDVVLIKKSLDLIQNSYNRLIAYECPKGGFEWFGKGDGVETLTAYGIMQFMEMKKIIQVDQKVIDRSLVWLMKRRLNGGFLVNSSKQYQMSHGTLPTAVHDAYILWALTECQITGLETELKALPLNSRDSYINALVAICLANTGVKNHDLGKKLVEFQKEDGSVGNGFATVTLSHGINLQLEVTALSAIAWTKLGGYSENIFLANNFLISNFSKGTTQATVLSLMAILANMSNVNEKKDSIVTVNGNEFIVPHGSNLNAKLLNGMIKRGSNEIKVSSGLMYDFKVEYATSAPATDNTVLELLTKMPPSVMEGESTEIQVMLSNKTDKNHGMTVSVIGIPGGFEFNHEKLKEMDKDGKFDFYEIFGRNLVLYWRAFEKNTAIELNVPVVARIPGKYVGQASRAYLFYSTESVSFANGLECLIDPKQ